MTFTALCCEHSGFYQLQKVRALRELMQPHLCPAMGPNLVQPHITRPLLPASSALGVCPDQTATLLPTQLTHLLQPFMDTTHTHLPHHSGSSSRSSNRLLLPPSAFPVHPHTHSVSSCAGSVGFFLTPSVCTHWSLCPEPGSSVQDTEGRQKAALPFPPSLPGGAHALCLPTALSGCT